MTAEHPSPRGQRSIRFTPEETALIERACHVRSTRASGVRVPFSSYVRLAALAAAKKDLEGKP